MFSPKAQPTSSLKEQGSSLPLLNHIGSSRKMISISPSSLFAFFVLSVSLYGVNAPSKLEGNSVDHAGILQSWDISSLARGKATYENLCSNCHGTDGITPALPLSPAFGKGPLKFGADPYSMFVTLTKGNGLMGPQTWMSPKERYDVIHYLREKFMKPMYAGYKPITQDYLEGLPKVTVSPPPKKKRPDRDFGPALASQSWIWRISGTTGSLTSRPLSTTVSAEKASP